jgi:phytoene dehydrogenase-like protein
LFHQTRGHFSKKYDLCSHVQLQYVVWLLYGGFGAVASSLLSSLSGYVDIGLILLWI